MYDTTADLIKAAGGAAQMAGPFFLCVAVVGGERVTAKGMAALCYMVAGFSALSALIHATGWIATSFGLVDAGYGPQEWHLALIANLCIGVSSLLGARFCRRLERMDASRSRDD